MFWKWHFLGHCSITQVCYHFEKFRRKLKIFVKVIQRFLYVQHVGPVFKKVHNKNQHCNCKFPKISMLQKPRHVNVIKIEMQFLSNLLNTYVYLHVSFNAVDIIMSLEEEIFGHKSWWRKQYFLFVWMFGCLEAE